MSVDSVPDNLTHDGADGCSFLFYGHFINAVLKDSQQLAHQVKFNITESVLRSQSFQLLNTFFKGLVFFVQLLNSLCYMSLGRAVTHIYKGVYQRIDFLLCICRFLSHIIQSLFIVHAVAGIKSAALFQLCNESISVLCKHFNLLNHSHIQCIAICIFTVAHRTLAALLHFANIGVNHLSIRSFSLAHFRIHTLTAATE